MLRQHVVSAGVWYRTAQTLDIRMASIRRPCTPRMLRGTVGASRSILRIHHAVCTIERLLLNLLFQIPSQRAQLSKKCIHFFQLLMARDSAVVLLVVGRVV